MAVPTADIAAIAATEMSVARSPYSMAVAPDSSVRNSCTFRIVFYPFRFLFFCWKRAHTPLGDLNPR